jgi:hypothetical protein
MSVFHIEQIRKIRAVCVHGVEDVAVRILVGAGLRMGELCGLALRAPDGLPDLMTDSIQRGRVELRVRWDAGAKGSQVATAPDHS